ncbi:MFS transporter [Komagataeibacter rhaeticus]
MSPARVLVVVLVCHFTAAFGAMGMPPFLSLTLRTIRPVDHTRLVGWLYVLPTICLAFSAPFWGRLSDRYGRKPLLIRAQAGLCFSFMLAGLSPSIPIFALALAMQGLLGGTFSASNAYLAESLPRSALAEGLHLTQASARLALILSPMTIGLMIDQGFSAQRVYLLIAILPAIAALLSWSLPSGQTSQSSQPEATAVPSKRKEVSLRVILVADAGFTLMLIGSFPYLIPYTMTQFGVGASVAGWLFGLPHIIYLIVFLPLGRTLQRQTDVLRWFAIGCAIMAATLGAQAMTLSLTSFIVARLLMGVGMTLGYLTLNILVADRINDRNAGRNFGLFDSVGKIATVMAGVTAGEVASLRGTGAVLVTSAAIGVFPALLALSAYRRTEPETLLNSR